MKETTIDQTLVLCDLDSLLLDAAGNLPQLQRDVLQLFASRGGRLTVFSQRSPRAVRSLLGGVRLSAPALVCGGTLAYNFSEGSGTALCSFEGMEESVLKMLPSLSGVGIALQMRDGSPRAAPMSRARTFCASCSIRTKSRCPFCPRCKRRWGTRQPSCMRSALHRIRWCLPRALSQAVPCSTPSALPPAMLPSS